MSDALIDECRANLGVSWHEWVRILSIYTTEGRVRAVLPHLIARADGNRFRHCDLAPLIGSTREKVTRALRLMRGEPLVAEAVRANVIRTYKL